MVARLAANPSDPLYDLGLRNVAHGEADAEGRADDTGEDAAVGVVELMALNESYPLHGAVRRRDDQAVERLIAEGHDLNALDDLGMTALHWAVYGGYSELVRALRLAPTRIEGRRTRRQRSGTRKTTSGCTRSR